MPSKIFSACVNGLEANIIEVEVDVTYGLRHFSIVGLGDKAIEESKERMGSAIKSTGFKSPHHQPQRVLVNLAPADLKKEGSLYDLPIALAYLLESKQIAFDANSRLFFGELSLNGALRPVKGALSLAIIAKNKNYKEIILPRENCVEAALALGSLDSVSNLKIIGVNNLKETINYLSGKIKITPFRLDINNYINNSHREVDMSWINGQETAKRAMEISASGGHNISLQGPPGTGKSLLAKALPSILPNLTLEEIIEVTKIYSIGGFLNNSKPLISERPFRNPHHSSSESSLIGGGNPIKPGEITLAHRGVLFLDEFPEFHRDVLESLRQPLEEGNISILRSKDRLLFPARFILVIASNPCPCGNYNNPYKNCICQPNQVLRYRQKLSGPLMDRIDLSVEVPQLKFDKISATDNEQTSKKIKEKIELARSIQKERFANLNILTNSEMQVPQIQKFCEINSETKTLLGRFVDSGKLSGRGYHRILKIGRTIADLSGSQSIKYDHIAEALMYRIKMA